jgi:ubiquinone/menaquinone biosynthesis C-methylase UbiE/DNA-binding transcriptional ArsR family regulator
MPVAEHPILDSLSALSDPTRCRMLRLLDGHELTVSEICGVLQLPQSSGSRQLKTLADADWVASRRDGTSRYYTLSLDGADGPRARLWQLTSGQLASRPGAQQDARRLSRVLARRSEASQQFFASSAGQWDKLREDLFGGTFAAEALLALLSEEWVVADLGCGTGALLPALAPHVGRVIGVDGSEEMLSTARRRVAGLDNVELRRGSLEALPLDAASVDVATLMLVLHHVPSPADALAEAGRVLKPGGRVLVVDMTPHDREEYRLRMGHVWLGFSDDHMRRLLAQAGFDKVRIHTLPPAADAKGPALFAATGTKS